MIYSATPKKIIAPRFKKIFSVPVMIKLKRLGSRSIEKNIIKKMATWR